MIGNPIDYDKKFKNKFPIFPPKFDLELRRYLNLIQGKEVLDLGIGQGRNSIPLVQLGFNVTGVDYSTNCLEICKNSCSSLKLVHSDIRNFDIEKNRYDLILSRCVLHFLHKDDVYDVIANIKQGIKLKGLVYIHVFSLEDPHFERCMNNDNYEKIENNIFHNKIDDTYLSLFTKSEVLEFFNDFKTISISQEYFLDQEGDAPHYAGVIKYVGQRI